MIQCVKSVKYGVFSHLSVFSPNAGKYGPEKTPYLDTFHAYVSLQIRFEALNFRSSLEEIKKLSKLENDNMVH